MILLMAVLLPLSVFEMSADNENTVKRIPLEVKDKVTIKRDMNPEDISAVYYGMINSVVTIVSSDLGEISLTITNCSTGEMWCDEFDSSTESQTVLPISGDYGIYEVVYITESGQIHEGYFTLE